MTNSGPAALNGVKVADGFSNNKADFSSDTFTAVGSGESSGFTASATTSVYNDIDDTVDLPANSSITYTVTPFITEGAESLSNTTVLTPPSGVTLSPSSNTSATDNDSVSLSEC